MNTLIVDLGSLPIHANQQELTNNQSLLSDSQLPIDISITDIIVRSDINTPHARNRMPSRHYTSPSLTSFGLSEKGKAVMTDVIRPNFSFEGIRSQTKPLHILLMSLLSGLLQGFLKLIQKSKFYIIVLNLLNFQIAAIVTILNNIFSFHLLL